VVCIFCVGKRRGIINICSVSRGAQSRPLIELANRGDWGRHAGRIVTAMPQGMNRYTWGGGDSNIKHTVEILSGNSENLLSLSPTARTLYFVRLPMGNTVFLRLVTLLAYGHRGPMYSKSHPTVVFHICICVHVVFDQELYLAQNWNLG
jgi:hypothetical protein